MPVEVGIDERNVERGKNQRREAKSEEKDYLVLQVDFIALPWAVLPPRARVKTPFWMKAPTSKGRRELFNSLSYLFTNFEFWNLDGIIYNLGPRKCLRILIDKDGFPRTGTTPLIEAFQWTQNISCFLLRK